MQVASLLDIAGTKAAVVQRRAEARDYLDIDALIRHGIDLPQLLAAGAVVYGRSFNPLITLKALSYFDDVATLSGDVLLGQLKATAGTGTALNPDIVVTSGGSILGNGDGQSNLVGSVASGTGSTLMVFLAKGDVALSITISAMSTLVGIVATPLLTRFYVDATVPVDVGGMLLSIIQIVALPVAAGLLLNQFASRVVRMIEPALPFVSVAAILAIIGAVVAGSQASIATVGPVVMVAVVLHNGLGLLGGYWGGRLLGFEENVCRTLALEVGMQNSGLAATLGKIYFSPLAALPGALFSVWHNLSGSILAGYWAGRDPLRASARPLAEES